MLVHLKHTLAANVRTITSSLLTPYMFFFSRLKFLHFCFPSSKYWLFTCQSGNFACSNYWAFLKSLTCNHFFTVYDECHSSNSINFSLKSDNFLPLVQTDHFTLLCSQTQLKVFLWNLLLLPLQIMNNSQSHMRQLG